MQQAWEKSVFQTHIDGLKDGQSGMLGKGAGAQAGHHMGKPANQHMQSTGTSDHLDKKGLPLGGGQLSGGVAGQQNPLLLTPAGLQLAQLQAQLTLQRLKLAQNAVGANNATAASVLSQVLSNVAMSQPLFDHLRTSAMVGNHQGGFPPGALGFPPPNPGLGSLVGGGFNQNPGSVRLNHYGGGGANGGQQQGANQHGAEYGKKAGSTYPADTDRRVQYGFLGGTSVASGKAGDGQYTPINSQAKMANHVGFQRNFYGQDSQGQQTGFGGNEQNLNTFSSAGHKEQNLNTFSSAGHKEPWKNPANLGHSGSADRVPNAGAVWPPTGPPFRARGELYNPEEPTSEPKFNHSGGGGGGVGGGGGGGGLTSSFGPGATQGFVGYQPLQTGEETLSAGPAVLQPHQISDYHAVTPLHLPHQCTICEKKVYNLKDWDQHVKGKLHLQNRSLFSESPAIAPPNAVHYSLPGVSDGCLNPGGNNSMIYTAGTNQDVCSGPNPSYLSVEAMKTYPPPGYTPHSPGEKVFPPRKSTPGRVVHICNLPEGSCTENDVINLGLPFGKVTNYILMRSTHQAFLEMAYVEAAQAMVQYHQLTPAMISDQKLLIRMSKRYKELQLKKPGKDVDSIIHDIHSQRERDEMQEIDQYLPERARSRSPISRSLSPRSHSPSFTSCSSAQSPQGAPLPPQGRPSNGLGPPPPCRGSWDWSAHLRRAEDGRERERERERDEPPWRNGGGGGANGDGDRPNGRTQMERRKPYLKPSDRGSPRSAEERGGGGGGGGGDGGRGGRDWYPRGSPQGMFPSYRNQEDDFYMKEQMYKSEKPPRPPYQRGHEVASKRRGSRTHRHSESEAMDGPSPARASEDRRQGSPARGRSNKTTAAPRRRAEREERENQTEKNGEARDDRQSKEKSVSPPPPTTPKHPEAAECDQHKDSEAEGWESGEDTEGECWYPRNMEELVTVDEVGGEDDSIIEPDLPGLMEDAAASSSSPVKDPAQEEAQAAAPACPSPAPSPASEMEEAPGEGRGQEEGGREADPPPPKEEKRAEASTDASPKDAAPAERPGSDITDFPSQEFKAALEETCSGTEVGAPKTLPPATPEPLTNHVGACQGGKVLDIVKGEEGKAPVTETEMQLGASATRPGVQAASLAPSPTLTDIEAPYSSREPDKVIADRSIPLGVEFVVARTGFYCQLCELFYTSEETAKTAHCRSTVHYRNLQRYLSQLAEESLLGTLTDSPATG